MNQEIPDVQAGKGRGTRDQIANIHWIIKESYRKISASALFIYFFFASALLTMPKPLTVWTTTNCGKFLKRWDYQTTLPAFWKICMQVKKQQLKLDVEQQTDSKLGKEYIKAVSCHPTYLTYKQNTSCKMLAWMKHKLELRLLGAISITSDMQMTHPYGRKWRENKEPLDEDERGECSLVNIQKTQT